jgi:ribosome-binding factor A
MKVLPDLRFEHDQTLGDPDRIEQLLRELHEKEGT